MKLVLLGTADSMKLAPYDDRSWQIWACQPAISYPVCKRVDMLFELHDESYWKDPAIVERLNAAKVPVLMQKKAAAIPLSEVYPLDDLVQHFRAAGLAGARYFTSTIAFMLAYALFPPRRYEAIALYGVHMAADEEYGNQRQAMEYWVGVANGMGIPVIIPKESSICSSRFLYGYDSESTILTEMRKMGVEFQQALTQAKQKTDADVQHMYELGGALKMLEKLRRLYT